MPHGRRGGPGPQPPLAIYFYWAHVHGRIDPPPPHMTTHDDSLLFVAGLVLMLSLGVVRGKTGRVAARRPDWARRALRHGPEQPAARLDRAASLALASPVPPASARAGLRRRVNLILPIWLRWSSSTSPSGGSPGGPVRARSGPLHGGQQRGRVVPGSPGGDPQPPLHAVGGRQPAAGNGLGSAVPQGHQRLRELRVRVVAVPLPPPQLAPRRGRVRRTGRDLRHLARGAGGRVPRHARLSGGDGPRRSRRRHWPPSASCPPTARSATATSASSRSPAA